MPTGYTASVADGTLTDFCTFALRCARNFGATIMQREESMDILPKLREESDYAKQSLAKSEEELARLKRMTLEKAQAEQEREHRERMRLNEEAREDHREKRERYTTMLEQVRRWKAPTADHRGLKKFMIEQLEESIRFDCDDEWLEEKPLEALDEWLEEKKRRAFEAVKRSAQDVVEERVRVAGSNAWIQALWESLPKSHSAVEHITVTR